MNVIPFSNIFSYFQRTKYINRLIDLTVSFTWRNDITIYAVHTYKALNIKGHTSP